MGMETPPKPRNTLVYPTSSKLHPLDWENQTDYSQDEYVSKGLSPSPVEMNKKPKYSFNTIHTPMVDLIRKYERMDGWLMNGYLNMDFLTWQTNKMIDLGLQANFLRQKELASAIGTP